MDLYNTGRKIKRKVLTPNLFLYRNSRSGKTECRNSRPEKKQIHFKERTQRGEINPAPRRGFRESWEMKIKIETKIHEREIVNPRKQFMELLNHIYTAWRRWCICSDWLPEARRPKAGNVESGWDIASERCASSAQEITTVKPPWILVAKCAPQESSLVEFTRW